MPFVNYEELCTVLIALFAALAACMGGRDIAAAGDRPARNRGVKS